MIKTKKPAKLEIAKIKSLSDLNIEQVPELLAAINAKIDSISNPNGDDEKNNVDLSNTYPYNSINISTPLKEASVKKLLDYKAIILIHQDYYNLGVEETIELNKTINFEEKDLIPHHKGYKCSDWLYNINKQLLLRLHANQLTKLRATRDKLRNYVSEEDKFREDMKDLVSIFKKH